LAGKSPGLSLKDLRACAAFYIGLSCFRRVSVSTLPYEEIPVLLRSLFFWTSPAFLQTETPSWDSTRAPPRVFLFTRQALPPFDFSCKNVRFVPGLLFSSFSLFFPPLDPFLTIPRKSLISLVVFQPIVFFFSSLCLKFRDFLRVLRFFPL